MLAPARLVSRGPETDEGPGCSILPRRRPCVFCRPSRERLNTGVQMFPICVHSYIMWRQDAWSLIGLGTHFATGFLDSAFGGQYDRGFAKGQVG
jgi:hypothetical protein